MSEYLFDGVTHDDGRGGDPLLARHLHEVDPTMNSRSGDRAPAGVLSPTSRSTAYAAPQALAVLDDNAVLLVSARRIPIEDVLRLGRVVLQACEENHGAVRDSDLQSTLDRLVADVEPDAVLRGIVGLQLLLDRLDHRVGYRRGDLDATDVHHPCHAAEPTDGEVSA